MKAQTLPMRFRHFFIAATLTVHLALIVGLILSGGILALLAALLLFVPLPGMMRADGTTYRWATLLLTFYVSLLLAEGYAQPQTQATSFWLAALAAADFIGLVACSRLTVRATPARTAG